MFSHIQPVFQRPLFLKPAAAQQDRVQKRTYSVLGGWRMQLLALVHLL